MVAGAGGLGARHPAHPTMPMRFQGTLKTWNDDRGFGFLAPAEGGEDIFVHIKAFDPRLGRPQAGQVFSFGIELGPKGRKRARNVEPFRRPVPRVQTARAAAAQWGAATLFVIPAFAMLFLAVAFLWRPPLAVLLVYVAASCIAFVAYAKDKWAARRGGWRTAESTLHVLSLVGGWPGALLAQQVLRHKSVKAEFRSVFWGTVVLNVSGFVALCSPLGWSFWVSG